MWFKKHIEIFVRHCNFSKVSVNKKRPKGFSREACHDNLMATRNSKISNITFFLDTFFDTDTPHFLIERKIPFQEIKEGMEATAFLRLLEYVEELKLHPETIVYFVEDDYLHKKGWCEVLEEAFTIEGVEYATLYDHRDKYFLPMYKDLTSKIFFTKSCHWRITPSTTNTYAMKFSTLKKHINIHKSFSIGREISDDHGKFCTLGKQGSLLISPLPAWSTHMEEKYMSPCVDWKGEIL